MSRIVVVGAGFAGLTAGAVLAARGEDVTILEARPAVGGLARLATVGGARIDLGPTILTDLAPLRMLAERIGTPLEALAPLARLDPGFVATFPGGVRIAAYADPARTLTEVRALGPSAEADWLRLLDLGARAHRLSEHYYARGDLTGPRDFVRFLGGGGIAFGDVWPFARSGALQRLLEAEVRTPRLRQFYGHFARLLGLEPDRAPAVALVIPHLLAHVGIWYPLGGITALAARLARLAEARGARLRLEECVDGVEIVDGRVRTVRTAAGAFPADVCVSAAGMETTARWMGGGVIARRTARLRPADTARVAWWLVEGRPALPVHHAFHFTGDPAEEPVYVNLPSVTDPDLTSDGRCIVYALRHAPIDAPLPEDFGDNLRTAVVAAGQWPGGSVLAHDVSADPGGCYGYAIGAGILSSRHPSQRVPGVANLILAGKTVFPGPGVANVIRSGLRAADLAEAAAGGGGR